MGEDSIDSRSLRSIEEMCASLAERVDTLSQAVARLESQTPGDAAALPPVPPIPESERDPFFSALSREFHPLMYQWFKECDEDNLYRVLNHQRGYACQKLQSAEGLSQIKILRVVYCLAKVVFNTPEEQLPPSGRRYRVPDEDTVRSWICGLLERIELPASSRYGSHKKSPWASFRDRRGTFYMEFTASKRNSSIDRLRNCFNDISLTISRRRIQWEREL